MNDNDQYLPVVGGYTCLVCYGEKQLLWGRSSIYRMQGDKVVQLVRCRTSNQ